MFKKLAYYFAYLLLVLLPLQGLAAANMSICNSMMQIESTQQKTAMSHCNMHMVDTAQNTKNSIQQHDCCKEYCAALCASLCGIAALASPSDVINLQATSHKLNLSTPLYASITPTNLQRPPIYLS
jgi:hypothetical protein